MRSPVSSSLSVIFKLHPHRNSKQSSTPGKSSTGRRSSIRIRPSVRRWGRASTTPRSSLSTPPGTRRPSAAPGHDQAVRDHHRRGIHNRYPVDVPPLEGNSLLSYVYHGRRCVNQLPLVGACNVLKCRCQSYPDPNDLHPPIGQTPILNVGSADLLPLPFPIR